MLNFMAWFQLDQVVAEMQRVYSTTKLRDWNNTSASAPAVTVKEAEVIQLEPGA